MPVSTPDEDDIVAILLLLVLHTPPGVVLASVIDAPAQTADGPVIGSTAITRVASKKKNRIKDIFFMGAGLHISKYNVVFTNILRNFIYNIIGYNPRVLYTLRYFTRLHNAHPRVIPGVRTETPKPSSCFANRVIHTCALLPPEGRNMCATFDTVKEQTYGY
jgi:hypothetical protein